MRNYHSINRNPYWTKAKFNSVDQDGNKVTKGQDILYYPASKTVLTGEKAQQAWRDYQASCFDEYQFNN